MGEFLFEVLPELVATALFLVVFIFGVRFWDHHNAVIACHAYGAQTGHEVKFADYSFWSYECLAKQGSGRWLPVNQTRGVDDETPVLGE